MTARKEPYQNRKDGLNQIETALYKGQIEMHYQPIVSIKGCGTIGYESLARSPELGYKQHSPAPILASHYNKEVRDNFFKYCFNQVKRQATKFIAPHMNSFVTINASLNLITPPMIEWMEQGLAASELDPTSLVIEITEDAVAVTHDHVAAFSKLKALGAKIAMDDYGAGASDETRLSELDFDIVKLDRSHLAKMHHPLAKHELQKRISRLKSEGTIVVVEGVENQSHMQLARDLACDFAQGRFISWPMTLNDLCELKNLSE